MIGALRIGAAVVAAGVLLALPASATAQTVLTLTGERLDAEPAGSSGTVECATSPGGTSTMTYDVTGVASGPYPGTFHETGSVSFNETEIISFSADFTIDSATGTIEGHKTHDPAEVPSVARCGPPGDMELGQVVFAERYTATVTGSPTGDHTESGRSRIGLTVQESGSGQTTVLMSQEFESGGPPGTTITLSPAVAFNPVSTPHTVTATVRDATMDPVQGMTVLFEVISPSGETARCVTDAEGICPFTYQGPDVPQADDIRACADTNVNGQPDVGEPCADAVKIWEAPATMTGQVTGGGFIRESRVTFAVHAKAATETDPVQGGCNVNDHIDNVRIKCLDVTSLVLTPTHATIFGQAEQDGISTNYRIDVDDLSDQDLPDTFQIQTDLGYLNGGTLTGGNIHIRP